MYFFGITRFSLFDPGSSAWKISTETEENYLTTLFSDKRLQVRFDIFINKALPIYEDMSKGYFYKHIIQYSSLMPEHWKKKLKKATEKYDFVVLNESGRDMKPIPFAELLDGKPSGTLVSFRIDDDDILSNKYLDNLSKYANKAFEGMIISFGKGTIASYEQGKFTDFRHCHRRFLALGMAFIGKYDADKNSCWFPRAGNHEKVDMSSPTIIDSRENMYVWTQSVSQDTKYELEDVGKYISSILDNYSPIMRLDELNELKKSFPTIANEIDDAYGSYKSLLSLKETKVESPNQVFPIQLESEACRYLISYELKQKSGHLSKVNCDKAITLSLIFSNMPKKIRGLYLSANIDIGWYSYIDIKKGVSKRSFIVMLEQSAQLEAIRIRRYNLSDEFDYEIKNLEVVELG